MKATPTNRSAAVRLGWTLASASVLAVVVGIAFAPNLGNGWVDWDDAENYVENPNYRGLGIEQLRWAATTYHVGVYQPVGWLICGAEYLLFGTDARGYHLTSLVLHAANAVLVYLLASALLARCRPDLRAESPGAIALGALVASALFAAHPLRTEAVAWASCQQYLPSASFALLAVLAYLKAHPPDGSTRLGWLAASWVFLLLAMLCKAPAIGVVGVLVVLDVYPLRRLEGSLRGLFGAKARGAWAEKLPFAALAGAFAVAAVQAKMHNRTLISVVEYGPAARLAHACCGVFFYPYKTLLPTGLCTNYFLPGGFRWYPWPALPAFLGFAAVSLGVILARKTLPGLAAAWAAYLILLAPNLEAVRVGTQFAADRYSYFATIPWVPALAVVLASLARRPAGRALVVVGGAALVAALIPLSRQQSRTWYDSESLARQVLASNPAPPPETLNELGRLRARRGDLVEAEAYYRAALCRDPNFGPAHVSVGMLYLERDQVPQAVAEFTEAVRLCPREPVSVE